MPLRDYEFVQRSLKAGRIEKFSLKGLTRAIDCTTTGRSLCKGYCCHWSPTLYPQYHQGEMARLSPEIRCLVANDGRLGTGGCDLRDLCLAGRIPDPERAVDCVLFPLGFNSAGRLILKRWVYRWCPRCNEGEPAYISMEPNLVLLFGQAIYDDLRRRVEAAVREVTNPSNLEGSSILESFTDPK